MAPAFRTAAPPAVRKRTAFLTRDEIVAGAALVLERDGYDALDMRSVAAVLGVRAAALYRHVENRAELDDLLFDHLMADCAPRLRGMDWRADLANLAEAWRHQLLVRRDATRIALAQISIGPNVARLMEAVLSILRRSGLADGGVLEAYNTYVVFVHGFASEEASQRELASSPGGGLRYAPPRPEWAEAHPTLAHFVDALSVPTDHDACFAFGLEAMIAGIERRLAASS